MGLITPHLGHGMDPAIGFGLSLPCACGLLHRPEELHLPSIISVAVNHVIHVEMGYNPQNASRACQSSCYYPNMLPQGGNRPSLRPFINLDWPASWHTIILHPGLNNISCYKIRSEHSYSNFHIPDSIVCPIIMLGVNISG